MEPGSREARVTALETQVHELAGRVRATQQDAAAARVLAGAADRDVTAFHSELRDFRQATVASFDALRADFVDLRTGAEQGFTEMRGKFDAAAAGQQQIVGLIETLIADQGRNDPAK